MQNIALADRITNVANGYLHQSAHIRLKKFYSPITIFTSERTTRWHPYIEVSNPKFQELSLRPRTMIRNIRNPPRGPAADWHIFVLKHSPISFHKRKYAPFL